MDNIQEVLNKLHEQDGANWKQIVDFPRYCISDAGDVYSTIKNKKLQPNHHRDGYLIATLYRDNKQFKKKIHRLVAEAFIQNPNHLDTVDHIDSDKTNNHVSNLQWMSNEDNIIKYHTEHGNTINRWFSVYLNGEIVGRWNSQAKAARDLKLSIGFINPCLRGNRKQAYGYTFVYDD